MTTGRERRGVVRRARDGLGWLLTPKHLFPALAIAGTVVAIVALFQTVDQSRHENSSLKTQNATLQDQNRRLNEQDAQIKRSAAATLVAAQQLIKTNNQKFCTAFGTVGSIDIRVPTSSQTTATGQALIEKEQAIINAFRGLFGDPAFSCSTAPVHPTG